MELLTNGQHNKSTVLQKVMQLSRDTIHHNMDITSSYRVSVPHSPCYLSVTWCVCVNIFTRLFPSDVVERPLTITRVPAYSDGVLIFDCVTF